MTWPMIGKFFIIFLSSSVGTLGFAIFMHAPRRAWLPASCIGGMGYALYWALQQAGMYEPMAIFIGSLLASVLAQYCARRMRMIATIFLLLAIIPLVPGLGLYRCMHFLAQEMYSQGADAGVRAMVDIVMIAMGLGMGSYMFRMYYALRNRAKGGRPS